MLEYFTRKYQRNPIFKNNLNDMFPNGMDPYATVGDVGIFYPQISKKSNIEMNLNDMFPNGMDPYATVGAVLHYHKGAVNQ